MKHTVVVRKKSRALWHCLPMQTIGQKMRGLMFRGNAIPLLFVFENEARNANAIHSLFCPRFDAIFLDSRKKIVDIRQNIAAWNPWIVPKKPAKYLIELPANEAKKARLGEQLNFVL